MTFRKFLITSTAAVTVVGSAVAGPHVGAPGVRMGAPTSTLTHSSTSGSVLGNMNASHASSMGLQHAAPNSTVGALATYKSQMTAALALTDPTAQAAAITAARQQLATTDNKVLTAAAITQIDSNLSIVGAPSDLGTTP